MQKLANLFFVVYKYATAFLVVTTPLFFMPGTVFRPSATYYFMTVTVITLALAAYIVYAFLGRAWHRITRFEIYAYALFSLSAVLSAFFSNSPHAVFFGNEINYFSGASLLLLPATIYLVRSLPDSFRNTLKRILLYVIGVSSFCFIFAFIFSPNIAVYFSSIFLGMESSLSLFVYLGLFTAFSVLFVRKIDIHVSYKSAVVFTAVIVLGLLVSLSSTGDMRPNFVSTMHVAKETFLSRGLFGMGAGDFGRAWQLYRPEAVLTSQYFDVDFVQGSGTVPTLFTTIGIFGAFFFLFLILGSLLFSLRVYAREREGGEKRVLGALLLLQMYFFVVSCIIPLSFSLIVLWMIIIGFSFGKLKTNEYSPSKAVLYIAIPMLIIISLHTAITFRKVSALVTYSDSQKAMQKNDAVQAYSLLEKATVMYPMDLLFRAKVDVSIDEARAILTQNKGDEESLKKTYLASTQKAVDAALMAVKANKENYQNYVALGRAYELAIPFDKEGAYSKAKKSYEEAIKLYPSNPYLYVMVARLESVGGTREAMRDRLKDALNKKQNFADALYLMSQLSAGESKADEALQYSLEALKIAPNDINVLTQTGLLLYGKRAYQDAITVLQKALEIDQNNQNVAYFLALSLRDAGNKELAKNIGEELIKRNPGNADLQKFLDSLQIKTETKEIKKETKKK